MNSINVVAIVGVYTTLVLYRRNRKLVKYTKELVTVLDETVEIMMYFSNIIDAHGIELNEFDTIVLNHFAARSLKRIQ